MSGRSMVRMLSIAAAGALVAAGVGLVLTGFAPAYLAPPDDDREACGRSANRQAQVVVDELEDIGLEERFHSTWQRATGSTDAPGLRFEAVRCGSGIEAGALPLRPDRRASWLDALTRTLRQDVPGALQAAADQQLTELDALRAEAREAQGELTLETVTLAHEVDLVEVLTADPGEVAPELRRLTTGVLDDLTEAEATVTAIDADRARITERSEAAQAFVRDAEVLIPRPPYLAVAAFAVAGALLGMTAELLGKRRPRSLAPATSTSSEDSPPAGPAS